MPRYMKHASGRYAVFYREQRLGLVQRVTNNHEGRWRAYGPDGKEVRGATFDGTYRSRRDAANALSRQEEVVA